MGPLSLPFFKIDNYIYRHGNGVEFGGYNGIFGYFRHSTLGIQVSPKFVEEVCWFNHLSFVPFKPSPVGFAAANGGSQRKLSFVDCRRFETRHSSQWGPNPWDLSRSMKIIKAGRFYGSLIPKAVFWKAFWCPTVPTVKKHTLSWALSTFRHPYMWNVRLFVTRCRCCTSPKWTRKVWVKTSRCPHISAGVLPSKQIDKFSTTIWGRISFPIFLSCRTVNII